MRAVVQPKFGPPENLEVVEMDDPTPGDGELLIEVAACPITFPDLLQLEDKYQFKVEPPYVPGNEVAGVVTAVGAGVEDFAVGDRVQAGLGGTGGFAELAVAKARGARKLPESIGFAESTGLQYAHGTTYYGLKWRGELKEGETLLITGAGGAVGMSAVELGKLMGARVIAAASTEEKLDLCRERGADETINYSNEDLKVRAKELDRRRVLRRNDRQGAGDRQPGARRPLGLDCVGTPQAPRVRALPPRRCNRCHAPADGPQGGR